MSDHEPLRDRILNNVAKIIARLLPFRVRLQVILDACDDVYITENATSISVGQFIMRFMERRFR